MTTRTLEVHCGEKTNYMAYDWLVKKSPMAFTQIDEQGYSVAFNMERDFEDLLDRLAAYFALTMMQEVASDRFAEIFTQEHEEIARLVLMEYKENWAMHFTRLVRMHLSEYVRINDRLNIEAFLLFNLRGFKEEAAICLEEELDHYNQIAMEEAEKEMAGGEDDLIGLLRSRLLENGPIEPYDSADLAYEDGEHHVFLSKGDARVRVSFDWMADQLPDIELQITDRDGAEEKDPLVLIPILIPLYSLNKLVIHGGLPGESYQLMQDLLDSWDIADLAIINCKGCPICRND